MTPSRRCAKIGLGVPNATPRETEAELRALCAEAAEALECAHLVLAHYMPEYYRNADRSATLAFVARLRKAGAR